MEKLLSFSSSNPLITFLKPQQLHFCPWNSSSIFLPQRLHACCPLFSNAPLPQCTAWLLPNTLGLSSDTFPQKVLLRLSYLVFLSSCLFLLASQTVFCVYSLTGLLFDVPKQKSVLFISLISFIKPNSWPVVGVNIYSLSELRNQ